MKTLQFKISGMHCGSCAKIIKMTIEELPGIGEIKINVANGTAQISAEDSVSPEDVLQKIKEAGYEGIIIPNSPNS